MEQVNICTARTARTARTLCLGGLWLWRVLTEVTAGLTGKP